MVSKVLIIAAVVAYVEARFGQENVPIAAISAVKGGAPGQAATIGGAAISDLLGAANSCAKLATADKIFTELGGGADALAAAKGMVTAEKNTNPFANGNAQNVCGDPSLPATPELRGITPLIDPAVDTAGKAKALSESSAANPLDATGLSVFDLMSQNGLGDLVVSQAAGGGAATGGAAAGNNNNNANSGKANGNANKGNAANNNAAGNANANTGNASAGNATSCTGAATGNAATGNANANTGNANGNAQTGNNANNNANGATGGNAAAGGNAATGGATAGAATGGADFGSCTPTIIFEAGLGGRPATEFTFQIADKTARGGQQEALNPNIITNALCNQLTNVCGANAAAKALCADAKAKVAAAGTRNKSTADLFNTAIGFPGAVTNPDGGPADVTPKAARRSMRRGLRL